MGLWANNIDIYSCLWHCHRYLNDHRYTRHCHVMFENIIMSCACINVTRTLLLQVLVSLLHGHSSTLDTVISWRYLLHCTLLFHVLVAPRHEYTITPGTIISCTSITVTQLLLQWILLFHVQVPLIYRYTIPLNTVISYICIIATRILCTQLCHILITLLHGFTCIHALIIHVVMLSESLFLLHDLPLHVYSCIPVIWIFNTVHDCFMLLISIWYSCYWTWVLICDVWN